MRREASIILVPTILCITRLLNQFFLFIIVAEENPYIYIPNTHFQRYIICFYKFKKNIAFQTHFYFVLNFLFHFEGTYRL